MVEQFSPGRKLSGFAQKVSQLSYFSSQCFPTRFLFDCRFRMQPGDRTMVTIGEACLNQFHKFHIWWDVSHTSDAIQPGKQMDYSRIAESLLGPHSHSELCVTGFSGRSSGHAIY